MVYSLKQIEILKHIKHSEKPISKSKISWELKITFSHVVRLIRDMINEGLLKEKKVGRTKIVSLTDKAHQFLEDKIENMQKYLDYSNIEKTNLEITETTKQSKPKKKNILRKTQSKPK